MPRLLLQYFGAFTAHLDGAPLHFAYARQAALLAYLGLAGGRPVTRAKLGLLLWPDKPPESVQTNLRQVLSTLGKLLRPPGAAASLLVVEGETVQIAPYAELWADVLVFRGLLADCVAHRHRHAAACAACAAARREACDLYRGDFLGGLPLDDSDEFEAWATAQREALQFQALAAGAALAHYHLLYGRTVEAQAVVAQMLAIDPLHEEINRLAMVALAAGGQPGPALAHYEQFRRGLARELGVEPPAATRQLAETLRVPRQVGPDPPGGEGSLLPPVLEPLVGRTVEINELHAWLSDPHRRLINIVGLGGAGKTHLAAAIAYEQRRVFGDGVVYVRLEDVPTPEQCAAALLRACGAVPRGARGGDPARDPARDLGGDPGRELASRFLWQQVAGAIGGKDMLLVLDHFEHLPAAGPALSALLQGCPHLVILLTSRRRLGLPEEWVFPLGGLDAPPAGVEVALEAYSATTLFVRAARQVRPDLLIDAATCAAVADICRLVEGLPLALVLLAAWVRVLPPTALVEELRRSIDVVRAVRPGAVGEQLSLRSVLQRSWRGLQPEAREALARLAVFRGGFERHAAAEVAGANLDILSALADHSLLQVSAEGRYSWHELVRQFAAEQLEALGEAEAVTGRHCAYFQAEAERNAAELTTFRNLAAFLWFGRETANLEAALAWAQAPASGVPAEAVQRLAAAIGSAGHRSGVHRSMLRQS
jgi:predicted ATPase/DNA-binding SARP family transcriptional activator